MAGAVTNLVTAADQAPASIPLPPASGARCQTVRDRFNGKNWTVPRRHPRRLVPMSGTTKRSTCRSSLAVLISPGTRCKLSHGVGIPLDPSAGDPVALYADGQLIGRGEVLELGGMLGVRILQLAAGRPL